MKKNFQARPIKSGSSPDRSQKSKRPQPMQTNKLGRGKTFKPGNVIKPKYQPNRFSNKKSGSLKVIPLSGLEEVGKNCTIYEYQNDIFVIDLGLMFPNEEMPGVDYVIPDISYLKQNKHKIKGVIITHGHLDHTGAIAYTIAELGFPPIYTLPLTAAMIRARLSEFKLDRKVKIYEISIDQKLKLGAFQLDFFRITHSIPDSMGLGIHTPVGTIVHTGDFKIDHSPLDNKRTEFYKIAQYAQKGVLAMLSDSTNSIKPGFCPSEKEIGDNIKILFSRTKGRIVFSTFASQVSRLHQIIAAASLYKRKVAVAGYSLEQNLRLTLELGYIKFPQSMFIRLRDIDKYPDNQVVLICTGSQGQTNSALGRIAAQEHPKFKLKRGDLVILSSSPIPGNERSVQNLMNRLFQAGAEVIYNKLFGVHASGHAYAEELKLMLALVQPKYFIPVHGERNMLVQHGKIAKELGVESKNVFICENGSILEFKKKQKETEGFKHPKALPIKDVFIDGLGVGNTDEVVLRDRQVLAADGVCIVMVKLNSETLKLIGQPDIVTKGFIPPQETKKLLKDTQAEVVKLVTKFTNVKDVTNWAPLRNQLNNQISLYLFKKTQKRPLVIPVILEV